MSEYEVSFAGPPAVVDGRSPGGVREWARVDADSRVSAYVQAYHLLTAGGKTVTVAPAAGEGNPLGFSDEEIREVLGAGVPFEVGTPADGYRIESLAELDSRVWRPVLFSLIATPVLLFLAIVTAGGGHGTPVPLIVLFPFMVLAGLAAPASEPSLLLAVIQFPVYGAVFGLAAARPTLYLLKPAVFLLHALAVVLAMVRFP